MKKTVFLIVGTILSLFLISSCTKEPGEIPVESVKLNQTMVNLHIGETATLTATVAPSNATDPSLTWTSSNTAVATVSNGVIIAVGEGTSIVMATAENVTAMCAVTVSANAVTDIKLDQTSASLKVNESITLTATVSPDNATDKTVTWTTSDASVATVSNGVVIAAKIGTATITASAGGLKATCEITVIATPVEKVTLDKTSVTLRAGESATLTATVSPDDATDKTVTWTSSNEDVATVSNGVVIANKVGTATITAQAGDKTATCNVTVDATPVTSVTLDKTKASLKVNETVTLMATVKPDDATDKTVTWTSSDESIATVKDGVVTAHKLGTAIVTAKSGDKTATCIITVEATPVTSITLNTANASLRVKESVTLKATVSPDDATDKTVTWTSSNASVATVTDGVVTAHTLGTATITAKAGDKTATCNITVVATPVTSVTLNKTSASLKVKETVILTATVKPDDATDKTVTWVSSNEGIASVKDGVVTALKIGTAIITAKVGDKMATCTVTVEPTPVTSVTLDKTSASLKVKGTVALKATVNPDDATDKTVTWSTSDASVATVKDGVVTALKIGTATITAKAGDKTASCTITVEPTPVTSVTLDKTSASLKVKGTVTLKATVNPDDATEKTVTWTTSDASVATVKDGVVTALKIGTATITAKAGDKTATCTVTVEPTPVTSVTLDKTSASLKVKGTVTLKATVNPSDATDKTVTWSTSNASVATVKDGVVTALKIGTATITAKAGDKTATCAITVEATPVTSITLDKTTATLEEKETLTLKATVAPDDATDKTVTWTSSNASVATVKDGVVTAVKAGTATITAKAGEKTATCAVTVKAAAVPVTRLTLSTEYVSLKVNEAVTIKANVYPDNATDKTVTWTSSNTSVATVKDGVVTAVKVGTATITAKAGTLSKTCTVNVTPATVAVTGVTLDKTSASLKVDETVTLTATVSPSDATEKTVTWSSSNSAVATVKDGVVTAVAVGTATITAKAGDKTATCTVTVTSATVAVTRLTLSTEYVSLNVNDIVTIKANVYPDNATDKTVTWSSSNPTVASVSNGNVTALKAGTALITAKAGSLTATCTVSVGGASIVYVTGISLNKTSATIKPNATLTLTATVTPSDATDKTVTWSSSNPNVASVSNGIVTGHKEGTAVITAEAGSKSATCTVTVSATGVATVDVTSVTLDKKSTTLKVKETVTLKATVKPDDATDKTVTWTSSNTAIATVKNGVVTGVKAGTATITAKAGSKTATCTVTVTASGVDDGGTEGVGYEDWSFNGN